MWASCQASGAKRSELQRLWLHRRLAHVLLHAYFMDRRANDNTEGKSLIYQLALRTSTSTVHLTGWSEDPRDRQVVRPARYLLKVPSLFPNSFQGRLLRLLCETRRARNLWSLFHLKTSPNRDVTVVWHPQRAGYTSIEPRQGEKYKHWRSASIWMSWEPVPSAGPLCSNVQLFSVLTCLEQSIFVQSSRRERKQWLRVSPDNPTGTENCSVCRVELGVLN